MSFNAESGTFYYFWLFHELPDLAKIYMGVAADCTYVSKYNGQENATSQILNNWNSASSLYKVRFKGAALLGLALMAVHVIEYLQCQSWYRRTPGSKRCVR
jgi:hypothetical protein